MRVVRLGITMKIRLRTVLCLSLFLLVGITAPAVAQPKPGGPLTRDPDNQKHEFDRGESIYAAPDAEKLLTYTSIKTNPTAMQELADLVVKFQALKDAEDRGRFDRAKARELAILKIRFYDKHNLGTALLKVPKAKMQEYIAFWRDFWGSVDQFRKSNPNVRSAGPFLLPSNHNQKLSALREAGGSLLVNVAEVLGVGNAEAETRLEGHPNDCRGFSARNEKPIKKCNEDEDRYFYFEEIRVYNYDIRGNDVGPFSFKVERYTDYNFCRDVWVTPEKKVSTVAPNIFQYETLETTFCGSEAGDNAGKVTKKLHCRRGDLEARCASGYEDYLTYCAPSGSDPYKRHSKAYKRKDSWAWFRGDPEPQEPNWTCR